MTLEEALPLLRSLSAIDKLRLIDELAKELLAERQAAAVPAVHVSVPTVQEPPEHTDSARWTGWLDSLLDAAAERIVATQREMQARGILDDAGRLATDALPEDMRPGSTTSVMTG